MKIEITASAKKQVRKLPQVTKIAVDKKIREMVEEQDNLQVKKMKNYNDMYRVRVGKYRIVYQRLSKIMKVVSVQHRKDVYRGGF